MPALSSPDSLDSFSFKSTTGVVASCVVLNALVALDEYCVVTFDRFRLSVAKSGLK